MLWEMLMISGSILGILALTMVRQTRHARSQFARGLERAKDKESIWDEWRDRIAVFYHTDNLRSLFRQAGFPWPITPETMIMLQFIIGLLLGSLSIALQKGVAVTILLFLVLFALGYFMPIAMLMSIRSSRQAEFVSGLRNFKEMLVLCLKPGLGIREAIEMATRHSNGVFREIMEQVYFRIGLTDSIASAFYSMHEEIGVDEVRALGSLLLQAQRNGTPIVRALDASIEKDWNTVDNKIERKSQFRQGTAMITVVFLQFGPLAVSAMIVIGGILMEQAHRLYL